MVDDKGIGLEIPLQNKPGRDAFDIRPKRLEEWVQGLPVAHVGETARQVYQALREVNRLRIPWKERHEFMERLRAPARYVTDALTSRFSGIAFPLPAKAQKVVALTQDLYMESALGYKSAIEDMLAGSRLFRDKRSLTVMLHRAIHFQGRALLTAYQTYNPFKPDTWRELHRLYQYAEGRGLHQTLVDNEEPLVAPKTTIATAYKQVVMLALASPFGLRHGEAHCTYNALEAWAELVQLEDPAEDMSGGGLFIVDPGGNHEPIPRVFFSGTCQEGGCRLLDASALAEPLQQEIALMKQGRQSDLLHNLGPIYSHDLLERLLSAWCRPPKRGFSRTPARGTALVVLGVTGLHQSITSAGEGGNEGLTAWRSHFSSRPVKAENDPREDVWDPIYYPRKMQAELEEEKNAEDPDVRQSAKIQQWEVLNESAGGFCVSGEGENAIGIQVGELVGLSNTPGQTGTNWMVAVVRWLKQIDATGVQLGLQVLAPSAKAAALRADDVANAQFQPGLLLPRLEAIGEPGSLIVPSRLFKHGDRLIARSGSEELHLKLGQIAESTTYFTRFRFVEESTFHEGGGPSEGDADNDFGKLWSEL